MPDHPLTRNEGATLAALVIAFVAAMFGLNIWLLSSVWEMQGVVIVTQNEVSNIKGRMETFSQLVSQIEGAVDGLQATKNIGEQLDGIRTDLSDLRDFIESEAKR
jgi:hypothetical protein